MTYWIGVFCSIVFAVAVLGRLATFRRGEMSRARFYDAVVILGGGVAAGVSMIAPESFYPVFLALIYLALGLFFGRRWSRREAHAANTEAP